MVRPVLLLPLLALLFTGCAAPDPALKALLPGEADRFIRVCGTLHKNAQGEFNVRRFELAANWRYGLTHSERRVDCRGRSKKTLLCFPSVGTQGGGIDERFHAEVLTLYRTLQPHMILSVRSSEACQDGMVRNGKETYLNPLPETSAPVKRLHQIIRSELKLKE
jgi:hypothetical protein